MKTVQNPGSYRRFSGIVGVAAVLGISQIVACASGPGGAASDEAVGSSADALFSGTYPFASGAARENFDYWDVPKRLNGVLISPAPASTDNTLVKNLSETGNTSFIRTHSQKQYADQQSGSSWNGCHAEVQFAKTSPNFMAAGNEFQRTFKYRTRFPDSTKLAPGSGKIVSQIQNYTSGSYLYKPAALIAISGGTYVVKFPLAAGGEEVYTGVMPTGITLTDGGWHWIKWKFYATTESGAGRMQLFIDDAAVNFPPLGGGTALPYIQRATIYNGSQNWDFQMGSYTYFSATESEVIIDYDDLLITDGDVENFSDATDWVNPVRASFSSSGGRSTLTEGTGTQTYGYIEKTVTYDVDKQTKLDLKVDSLSAGAAWNVKVQEGTNPEYLFGSDKTTTGVHTFDLKGTTGWSGTKTFKIRLFVVGGVGKTVTFDYIHKVQ